MLEDVGFSRKQAETSVGILVEIMESKLASKQDLAQMESRLTIKLGAMMGAMMGLSVAALAVVLKLG